MTRGDLVVIAMPGDFSKPRPALVIQADQFEHLGTVAVLLVTGTLVDAPLLRVTIKPGDDNGLLKASQIMIDKPTAVRRDRVGKVIGRADDATMLAVSRSLAVFLGIA